MKQELLPQNRNSSPKRLKKHEKTPQKKKSVFQNTFVFSQGQISPFYKIMLKMKLFLEKMIEKTPFDAGITKKIVSHF